MARAVIATVLTAWAFSVPVHAQQEIRLIAPEPGEGFREFRVGKTRPHHRHRRPVKRF